MLSPEGKSAMRLITPEMTQPYEPDAGLPADFDGEKDVASGTSETLDVVAHGTHDSEGVTESFFIFACAPRLDAHKQAYLAQLVVPFLHSAWIRTRMNARIMDNDAPKPAKTSSITSREREILSWIYLGKSHF